MKSLSSKIIFTVLLLLMGAFGADFIIATTINRSVQQESDHIVSEMQNILAEKDTQIGALLDKLLAAEEGRLASAHNATETNDKLNTASEESLLRGKGIGISTSVVSLIADSMMSGEASSTENIIDILLENPTIASVNLWRVDGTLAFRDNQTINIVNMILEDEAFEPRDVMAKKTLTGTRAVKLEEVVNSDLDGISLETNTDVEGADIPVVFSYFKLENTEDCQGCHGENAIPRGVLEVGISRAELVRLQEESAAKLEKLSAAQKTDVAKLRNSNIQLRDDVTAQSITHADSIEKITHQLNCNTR